MKVNEVPNGGTSMTREEQIKQQADTYTDDASNYAEWSDDGWSDTNDIELIEKAFIEGAKAMLQVVGWSLVSNNAQKTKSNTEVDREWLIEQINNKV